jgi:nucleolar protein 53
MARHQSSRKGKKAWRKNVDIGDIQRGLESSKDELIHGGIIQEKKSSDLYFVDLGKQNLLPHNNPGLRRQSLKSDVIISQRSTVPSVHTRTKEIRDVAFKESSIQGLSTNHDRGYTLSHPQSTTTVEDSLASDVRDVDLDLWDPIPKHSPPNPALEKPRARIQASIIIPSESTHHTSLDISHSYNPSSQEYDSRLLHECEIALRSEKERRLVENETLNLKKAAMRSGLEAERAESRAEMSEWDELTDYEPTVNSDESPTIQHKRLKRKTQSQRNRILRRKDETRRERAKDIEKAKMNQLSQLHTIVQDISSKTPPTDFADGVRDSNGCFRSSQDVKPHPKPNRVSLPPETLEILLPDELPDTLRQLRPQGNILRDSYTKQLARGSFEYRCNRPFRSRASVKRTEKWTYKDFLI